MANNKGIEKSKNATEPEAKKPDMVCAFCKIHSSAVEVMVAGPDGVYICDYCVEACVRVMSQVAHTDKPPHRGFVLEWRRRLKEIIESPLELSSSKQPF